MSEGEKGENKTRAKFSLYTVFYVQLVFISNDLYCSLFMTLQVVVFDVLFSKGI